MAKHVTYISACPICGDEELTYEFATSGGALFHCEKCDLLICDPTQSQMSARRNSFWDREARSVSRSLSDDEKLHYLKEIQLHASTGHLLEIGCGSGTFLQAAQQLGYTVTGYEGLPNLATEARTKVGDDVIISNGAFNEVFEPDSFDIIVLFDTLSLFPDQLGILKELRSLLRIDGVMLITLPVLDSIPPRLFRQHWVEFHKGHSLFFNTQNIQNALFKLGFDRSLVQHHYRNTNTSSLINYLSSFDLPAWIRFSLMLLRLLPNSIKQRQIAISGAHAIVITRAVSPPLHPTLSVIVPVYNERNTFRTLMDQLLAKELPNVQKEIIIVESNSKDGTREEVLAYQDIPNVRIVLQDKPRGKGNAVRAGFEAARGQFILIQDADLEYDLNDYDILLKPLIACEQAFVIGSRHKGSSWKLRKFNDAPVTASFFNVGHVIFLTLFNVFYGQHLKDPFSMFKVFRRECLYGLTFECNRFDFDFELVIKLLRKGYQPIEIPVNYNARSLKEGKKVSAWRDPLTWIKALVKFRTQPLELNIQPLNRFHEQNLLHDHNLSKHSNNLDASRY